MKHSVIAAVDLDHKAADIVRRAANLARLCQAGLLVAHAVDEHALAGSACTPFIQASEVREGTIREAKGWLVGLLHHLGISGAEIAVQAGRSREVLAELATARNACYLVTGQSKWGALGELAGLSGEPGIAALGCEVISVGDSRWSAFRRASASPLPGPA